jgi:hypothetical protein
LFGGVIVDQREVDRSSTDDVVAEHPAGGRIRVDNDVVDRLDEQGIGRLLEDHAVALLGRQGAAAQSLIRERDVDHPSDRLDRPLVVRQLRGGLPEGCDQNAAKRAFVPDRERGIGPQADDSRGVEDRLGNAAGFDRRDVRDRAIGEPLVEAPVRCRPASLQLGKRGWDAQGGQPDQPIVLDAGHRPGRCPEHRHDSFEEVLRDCSFVVGPRGHPSELGECLEPRRQAPLGIQASLGRLRRGGGRRIGLGIAHAGILRSTHSATAGGSFR